MRRAYRKIKREEEQRAYTKCLNPGLWEEANAYIEDHLQRHPENRPYWENSETDQSEPNDPDEVD